MLFVVYMLLCLHTLFRSGWSFPAGKNWSHKIVTNFIGELQIWDAIKYRISFGGDLAFWGGESHSEPNYYSNLSNTDAIHATAYANMQRGWTWQLENIITYDKDFGEHHVNVVLGQSAKEGTGWWINAEANKLYNFSKPWVTVAQGLTNFCIYTFEVFQLVFSMSFFIAF